MKFISDHIKEGFFKNTIGSPSKKAKELMDIMKKTRYKARNHNLFIYDHSVYDYDTVYDAVLNVAPNITHFRVENQYDNWSMTCSILDIIYHPDESHNEKSRKHIYIKSLFQLPLVADHFPGEEYETGVSRSHEPTLDEFFKLINDL